MTLSKTCAMQFEAMRTLSHCVSELSQKDVRVSSHMHLCQPLKGLFDLCGHIDRAKLCLQSSSKVLAQNMADELMSMPLDEAIPLTRACGAFFISLDTRTLQEILCSTFSGTDIQLWRRALSQPHTDCRDPSQVRQLIMAYLHRVTCRNQDSERKGKSQTTAWCSVRTSRIEGAATKTFDEVFGHLIAHGMTPDDLYDAVCKQVSNFVT